MSDEKPERNYHFEEMPFEMLMTQISIDGDDEFNHALWDEQSERFEKLGIADAELLSQVDKHQDSIDARLKNLEAKFEVLIELLKDFVEMPRISLNQYLEDKTK